MKTVEELIQEAEQAITDGDLEKAKELTNQAKAQKEIDGLKPDDDEEKETLKAKVSELEGTVEDLQKTINDAPAQKAGVNVQVTEDETDKKAAKPWNTLGEFLGAVKAAALTPHRIDERLKAAEEKAVLGASEGVPSDGGYMVQPTFVQEIFTPEHDQNMVLERVRRLPMGANSNRLIINAVDETSRVTGSRWGGVQAYWASEGDSVTDSKPKFREISLELNKLFALMYATDELLRDTTALAGIAREAINEEIVWKVVDAVFNGTGAGQPEGILNSSALVTVPAETGQGAATVIFENIINMWARMHARSRRNAIWFINQDIEPQLFSMDMPIGTGGVPVYLPAGGLSQSPFGTLMGRPLVPIEQAKTLGTVGDISLMDLSQYLYTDKDGVQEASSMHVQFLTGQMTFRWTYRLDGKPGWRTVVTPANGTNTQSPFIALATRS